MIGREYDAPTRALPGIEREPTPVVTTQKNGQLRWATLHKGALHRLSHDAIEPLESAKAVRQQLGINAALIAEIHLGPDYQLLLFDRGTGSQGVEEPVIDSSQFSVSDRYLLIDMAFAARANMRHGLGYDLDKTQGMLQLCPGASLTLGRKYDHGGQINTGYMPDTVSEKHASISIDFDGTVFVGDNDSANLTIVHYEARG